MATIRDVARLAGVAPVTVSRVINNSGYVSDETRRQVEHAIAELSYIPSKLGQSLRSKRTHTIALVATDITNPFWTTVARGVEDAAHEAGYHLILCNTDESLVKERNYVEMLLSRQVDGFLLAPAESKDTPVKLIQHQGPAVVVIDRRVPADNVDVVRTDSKQGAFLLTQHLLSLGHRDIAILTGRKQVSTAIDRAEGYQQAMTQANIPAENHLVFWGEFTQDAGYNLTQKALKSSVQLTALITANNFIAVGAMRALDEDDLKVPDDMSLVTFDDLPPTMTIRPFFTMAYQPAYEIGYQAAEMLLRRLSDDDLPFQEIILPIELIVRQSSGPYRKPRREH